MEYGCIHFDDVNAHASGWAAVAGDDAVRVSGTANLGTDAVWLTNLEYDLMYQSGLQNNVRFRRQDFLRIKVGSLLDHLGIPAEDPKKRVEAASIIFSRIMRLASAMGGIDRAPPQTLPDGLRERAFPPDEVYPDEMIRVFEAATSYFTTCEASQIEGDLMTFWLPQITLARKILRFPMPTGQWRRFGRRDIPGDPKSLEKWHRDPANRDRLMLVRADLKNFDRDLNPLLNFGSMPMNASSGRGWITSYELMRLYGCAEVRVREGYVCESAEPNEYLRDQALRLSPEYEASITTSIYAENLWTAASKSLRPRVAKNRNTFNPWAPFVRALDRMACLPAAEKLQEAGLGVVSYGVGRVYAKVPQGMTDADVVGAANYAGLIPPMMGMPKDFRIRNRFERPPGDEDYSDRLHIVQNLYACGRYAEMMQADRKVVEGLSNV